MVIRNHYNLKLNLFFFSFILSIYMVFAVAHSDPLGTQAYNEEIINIDLDNKTCFETLKTIISSDNYTITGIDNFNGEFLSFGSKENKNLVFNSIKVNSSEGILNFSLIQGVNNSTLVLEPHNFTSTPGHPAFVEVSFISKRCLSFREEWSLLRYHIVEGSYLPTSYTININRRLGNNAEGYIFLLGVPYFNATYLQMSKSQILSTDPISVSFIPLFNEEMFVLDSFIDLYYFPNPLIKTRQTDLINLDTGEISHEVEFQNLANFSVFYSQSEDKINFFYSNKSIVNEYEIKPSRGFTLPINLHGNVSLNKSSCSRFFDRSKDYFYPFRCVSVNGEMDISNYLNSEIGNLPVDFEYTLKYPYIDNLVVTDSDRCISYKEISIPPIQVIQEVQQPKLNIGFNLPEIKSCSENNQILINHNDLVEYISPRLIESKNDFLKEEAEFKKTNFSLIIPSSSISIEFNAVYKNRAPLAKVLSIIYFIASFVSVLFLIPTISTKIKIKYKKKWFKYLYVIYILFILLIEFVNILSLNPSNKLFTLLSLSPLLGIFVGICFFLICKIPNIQKKFNLDKLVLYFLERVNS